MKEKEREEGSKRGRRQTERGRELEKRGTHIERERASERENDIERQNI